MTSSNGNIFRVTGHLCGEFTGPGEFPTQRPVTRSFDVFSDQRLNKRLSKQPRGWWFETQSWSLWRHCNALKCHVRTVTKLMDCSQSNIPIFLCQIYCYWIENIKWLPCPKILLHFLCNTHQNDCHFRNLTFKTYNGYLCFITLSWLNNG